MLACFQFLIETLNSCLVWTVSHLAFDFHDLTYHVHRGVFDIGALADTGIKEEMLEIGDETLKSIISGYTIPTYNTGKYINDWMKAYFNVEKEKILGYLYCFGNDFQTQNYIRISNIDNHNHSHHIAIDNLIQSCIYLSVRKVIPATWLNDRDQFLYPRKAWREDREFQQNCMVFALFNNNIQLQNGTNHWIPFTEDELQAPDKFQSHFMSDFIAGKCKSGDAQQELDFAKSQSLIPTEPIQFSPIHCGSNPREWMPPLAHRMPFPPLGWHRVGH